MKTATVAQHTSTPWQVDHRDISGPYHGREQLIATAYPEDRCDDESEAIANAAFIVRSVNSHEELLSASKELIGFLKKPMNLRAETDLEEILLSLNRAIRKADGL